MRRDRWVSQDPQGGVFQRTATGWLQPVPGFTFSFAEENETPDRIQLYDGTRGVRAWLYNDHADLEWPGHPRAYQYAGSWG